MISVLCPLRVLSGVGIHDSGVVCGLHTGYLCFKPIDDQLGGLAGAHCRDRGHLAPGMITGVKKQWEHFSSEKIHIFSCARIDCVISARSLLKSFPELDLDADDWEKR